MTKKELAKLIQEFVASRDDSMLNEWYCTEHTLVDGIMGEFADWIGVKLGEKK